MKKLICASFLVLSLAACEDSSQNLDEAKKATNEAMDTVQQSLDSFNMEDLNFDSFGDAARQASELASSVKETVQANLDDPEVFNKMQDKVQNAYSCFVDAASESKAEELANKIMNTIDDEQTNSLLEKAIEKAQDAKECVM